MVAKSSLIPNATSNFGLLFGCDNCKLANNDKNIQYKASHFFPFWHDNVLMANLGTIEISQLC